MEDSYNEEGIRPPSLPFPPHMQTKLFHPTKNSHASMHWYGSITSISNAYNFHLRGFELLYGYCIWYQQTLNKV